MSGRLYNYRASYFWVFASTPGDVSGRLYDSMKKITVTRGRVSTLTTCHIILRYEEFDPICSTLDARHRAGVTWSRKYIYGTSFDDVTGHQGSYRLWNSQLKKYSEKKYSESFLKVIQKLSYFMAN